MFQHPSWRRRRLCFVFQHLSWRRHCFALCFNTHRRRNCFALCFNTHRGEDAAFALCFNTHRGEDTALPCVSTPIVAKILLCLVFQHRRRHCFALCFNTHRGEDTALPCVSTPIVAKAPPSLCGLQVRGGAAPSRGHRPAMPWRARCDQPHLNPCLHIGRDDLCRSTSVSHSHPCSSSSSSSSRRGSTVHVAAADDDLHRCP